MNKLKLKELPFDACKLLEKISQESQNLDKNVNLLLLKRHLKLVYNVGLEIVKEISNYWTNLKLLEEEISFGTATHDIGKAMETNELYGIGDNHERVGYNFLLENGINENFARFAKTHSNWTLENLKIEDLIVILADKIWKGKRIDELEERLTEEIATITNTSYWDVNVKLDAIISKIVMGADNRLNWQNEF